MLNFFKLFYLTFHHNCSTSVNVRKQNVRFGKPNTSFVWFGPKRLKSEQDWFGTSFVFDKPDNFVRISDSANIRTVWEPNQTCIVQNPIVRISDVYCIVNLVTLIAFVNIVNFVTSFWSDSYLYLSIHVYLSIYFSIYLSI